jgi:hypothetical protein
MNSTSSKPDSVTKQQLFEKVRQRMAELGLDNSAAESPFHCETTPDVVVISGDQTLLFESQNLQVTHWLYRRYGFNAHDAEARDRIRVHPCEYHKIIDDLKAAGFKVNC